VDNDGKVGIGTTTPLHGLTVKKSTWLDGAQHFFYSDSNIALKLSQLANPKFFYLNQDPSGNLNFMSNDVVSRLNIQQDGNVGIGTTSPSERLVVGDNLGTYPGERIVIGGSTPGTLTGLVIGEDSNNRGWMLWSVDDDIMVFGTKVGGALYNTINLKLGNVGIGGWPDSRLKIKGSGNTITTSGLNVSNSDNISSLFVRDDGNVGIGTTSPQDKLDVDGNVRANRFSDTSDTGYYVDPYGSTSATFRGNLSLANDGIFQNPGGGWAMLQNHSGHLYLGPDSSASQSIIFRHGTSDRINFQLDGSANDASPEFRTNGTYLIIGAKEDNPMYLQWDQSAADQHVYVNGYITPNKMYDRDNTAYYIDPSSTGTALTVAGDVGIGTTSPQGKLDVNGAIYQRGSQLHADYVFENDYKLESIKEHADFMWKNKHLKAIPRAKVDNQGQEIVEVGAHRKGIVEELEKAHIYISQLEARLAKLEELLNVRQ
jgi:hypothetical protein